MFRSLVYSFFAIFVICSFCGNEFRSLGRHTWRCKEKLNSDNDEKNRNNGSRKGKTSSTHENSCATTQSCSLIKCCCGKICNGQKGLKMHQRSCRVIQGLGDISFDDINVSNEISTDIGNSDSSYISNIKPIIKPGIKLPKTNSQWQSANDYFHTMLPISLIDPANIGDSINKMNTILYNYFKTTYGIVDTSQQSQWKNKYEPKCKKELKLCLRTLKRNQASYSEIQYVSRLLRAKLNDSNAVSVSASKIDDQIRRNFWGFIKQSFNHTNALSPTFNASTCTEFFSKFFSTINPVKSFTIPSWIPSFSQPSIPYDLSPPSYQQITKVIRRIKASGSPCPLDKISIIPFKRCPYLRSFITEVIRVVWLSGEIPKEWKSACTILIHKKGNTSEPANFRPITLESIPLKILTSCIRDSMFTFLSQNGYLEHRIQKGFLPKLSGTFEHTAQMANIINKARAKQRSLVITLLDLKNAFGEVHHNLIPAVLSYHHIPEEIQHLIRSLYSNFHTSIVTDTYQTPFLKVGRGVLQGDCLSPLTFNLCFNTFIHYISHQKFNQFGFSLNSLYPTHWFQFADDAAVITGLEKENQVLLNHFSRWCTWAGMIIRVDKCSSFGIKKASTSSIQFLPKLTINNVFVPPIDSGKSFRYLGRYFNFSMDNQHHMSDLLDTTNTLMNKINDLPCHPKNKLLLYHRFLLSKISWNLTIADISKTWIIENLDSVVSKYIRQWLELPISATLSSLIINKSKYGISLVLPSTKFVQCQTTIRNTLKSSPNYDIVNLWEDTSHHTNIQYDQYKNTKHALKAIQSQHEDRIHHELISQGFIISSILKYSFSNTTPLWSKVQQSLPKNIFNFTIKYLNNTLATRKNLHKWSLSQSPSCSFCLQSETLQHIVSSCKSYLDHGRYNWRHDSVLLCLSKSLSSLAEWSIYADLPSFPSPSLISGNTSRPDLILHNKRTKFLYIVELTVGFESNLKANSERKLNKYLPLVASLSSSYDEVKFINVSMSALGVFDNSCESLTKMLKDLDIEVPIQRRLLSKVMNIAIRSTYYIFCRRNKDWTNPDLMDF